MKHKLWMLLLLLTMLLCLSVSASADILWEPYENDYYNTAGYKNFDYMDRTYIVPEGMTANVYQNPETGGLIKTLEAGTRIYIGPYATINSETWAAGYPYGDWDNEGWVRLDRLQRTYEHEDFAAQFGDSFVETDDKLTQADIETEIQTWTYPGSGESDRTVPKDALGDSYNDGVMDFRYVYTDPDGGRWGYVGYYMGRCGWVYLDDPESTDPPVFPQEPENTVTNTSPEEAPGPSLAWILLPVAALVAITAAAIVVLKNKKQRT